jgi:hypothetical protein
MCADNLLPFLKHRSVVTNLLGSHVPYLQQATIQILFSCSPANGISSPWYTWLNEPTNRRLFFSPLLHHIRKKTNCRPEEWEYYE